MNIVKFVFCSILFGLIVTSSAAIAKQFPKPTSDLLNLCPCWIAEGGWEEAYWLIDEGPLAKHHYFHPDAFFTDSIVREPDGSNCFTNGLDHNDYWCRVSEGVSYGGNCPDSVTFYIYDLTDEQVEACQLALQEITKRAFQFE